MPGSSKGASADKAPALPELFSFVYAVRDIFYAIAESIIIYFYSLVKTRAMCAAVRLCAEQGGIIR